jgi:hypothetical protein
MKTTIEKSDEKRGPKMNTFFYQNKTIAEFDSSSKFHRTQVLAKWSTGTKGKYYTKLAWRPKTNTKEYILAAACSDGSAHVLNLTSTLDQQTLSNEEPFQQLSVTTAIFPLDSTENSEVWKHYLFIL